MEKVAGEGEKTERVMQKMQQRGKIQKTTDTGTGEKRCPVSSTAVDCVAQMLMRQKDVKDKKGQ